MIWKCKKCEEEVDELNKLSGFSCVVKIPQFNNTTGRATGHIVRSAVYIGLCQNCVEETKNSTVLSSDQDSE
jgi:hypothetical protein